MLWINLFKGMEGSKEEDVFDTVLESVKEFAERSIAPVASKVDEEDLIPVDLYRELRDHGLMTLILPQEMGGLGLPTTVYVKILEIVSRYSGGIALSLEAHNSLGLAHLSKYGSKELQSEVVPRVVKSGKPVAWALTEPRGGSDARRMATKAVNSEGGYIINGTKTFITHGFSSEYIVLIAKTETGITSFLVDGNSEGLTRQKLEGKLGTRGPDTSTLVFEDVFVPKSRVIGKEGEGFEQAMDLLDGGRIAVGAMGVGIARGSILLAVDYAKQRMAFGSPISEYQSIRFGLAELEARVDASSLLVEHAARLRDQGRPHNKEGAEAKYISSQVAMDATRFAIQIYGGYGYFRGNPVERMYRDAKLLEIGEGTNEVLKMIIAKELFSR
jgi:alkylation response protein AidB-like acyl-CoA dehydrogenase